MTKKYTEGKECLNERLQAEIEESVKRQEMAKDQYFLNEALPEAQENVLSALKRYGLVLFTELNQPMRWQRDDLESLAYYIDKYTEALDVINDGFEETGYKWLQRLEVDIDDNTQNLDVVWENSDGELDVADAFLEGMEDKIEEAVENHCTTWDKEEDEIDDDPEVGLRMQGRIDGWSPVIR